VKDGTEGTKAVVVQSPGRQNSWRELEVAKGDRHEQGCALLRARRCTSSSAMPKTLAKSPPTRPRRMTEISQAISRTTIQACVTPYDPTGPTARRPREQTFLRNRAPLRLLRVDAARSLKKVAAGRANALSAYASGEDI
jgi:hypothetical protein